MTCKNRQLVLRTRTHRTMCKCSRLQERNMLLLMLPILLTVFLSDTSDALDLSQCRTALGMQSGAIPDSAITASSSYDEGTVGPQYSRIRTEKKGGAWCPKPSVEKDSYEYLQIDLQQLFVITMVETQGRFGNGLGQEYTPKYLLEYQREDNGEWMRFRNQRGEEIFQGNDNTYLAELREVYPPIIAKRIRFIPYSRHPRTVCMRVEIYGCRWVDGVVSYNMPQGARRGSDVVLYDFTYDGVVEDDYLKDGLGQLTDGQEGDTNFRLDPQGLKMKGYEWVGWRNATENGHPVVITFKFDVVRNFSAVILHCNNFFTKDVRVFKTALIYFSIGGSYYLKEPVRFAFTRDTVVEYARQVMIRLNHNVGRYVRIVLFFDSKWIMISEVKFESEPAVGNFSEEIPPPTTKPEAGKDGKGVNKHSYMEEFDVYRRGNMPPRVDLGLGPAVGTTSPSVHQSKEPQSLDESYIGIIVGALAALVIVLCLIVVIVIMGYRRRKHNNNRRTCMLKPMPVDGHVTINLNDLRASTNDTYSSRDYAVPDVTKSSLVVALPPSRPPRPIKPPPVTTPNMTNTLEKPISYDALYAAADIINVHSGPNMSNLQGVSGNNVYASQNSDLLLSMDYSVMEFPRENLKFIEVLGEGQFGEVHLCEAVRITEYLQDDFVVNRTASRSSSMLVAVKMLRREADDRARADFHKEIKIMSQLKDPNIVRVMGVCTTEEPLCMIVEYMKYGDLHQFLQDHVPESPVAIATNAKYLSYGCLIFISSQIASGMKFLESLNMVHRDLATRNCLVGHHFCIKISDFGMSRSLYSADYYRIEGKAVLPIRWMAWESILLGKFTTKSDVWSFAVTLWEVLTFAKEQPYDSLTDEQVIENAGHYYRNDNQQLYLPQPPNCPREIYDLMRECWNRQELERPSFREIHMFLQRKNMGYNPKDEKLSQIKVPVC
ncbi:discoidin domain-containing receptor 2-like isoform X2 [Liolophura sinensis]|uniref:discoidin domain-containing receptor 2-like isoform X2 n=1 Tax=Liolophura sinensis TaxID=3198878 RepID=UPI003158CAB3